MSESAKPETIARRAALGILRDWANDRGPLLDVGAGPDTAAFDWPAEVLRQTGLPISRVRYDQEQGDAQTLANVGDRSQGVVYASHVLEHLPDPREALANWCRVCRPGGQVFVAVPHRLLYECGKEQPPSHWAGDHHLWFFEPWRHGAGRVLGLFQLLAEACPADMRLDYFATCDWGWARPGPGQPVGEYQIEARLRRAA